jgi:hypothetical protein
MCLQQCVDVALRQTNRNAMEDTEKLTSRLKKKSSK